ncbi:intein [Streptomyces sp. SLBN-118]|uniref:polymorphic toxin type 27 domain-containing protein n=1 Tax=Streptomyces sp. SLBN-118 TaxID=2768454 RepID=UPI001153D1AF|nr:polymorphic toxin type 27 domain-containing protein [Streptomyces sp. SLBN-118]TQK51785.1 intein [Streptomyces sp. SLBN-118]
MSSNAHPPRRRRVGRWSRLLAATALATSLAVTVSGSGLQTPPADTDFLNAAATDAQDVPEGFNLEEAAKVRQDQCRLNYILRKGGAEMKAIARGGLAGTDEELHAAAASDYWDPTPLSLAYDKDHQHALDKLHELNPGRQKAWQDQLSSFPGFWDVPGYDYEPPGNPGDDQGTIFWQTGLTGWIADQFWTSEGDFYEDMTPPASKESVDAVTSIATTRYYPAVYETYEDRKAWEGMTFMHPMYADDARIFLQNGGFPTTAPDPDSMEFRIDVENLKARFASCASHNPYDPHKVLGAEAATASVEWQNELTGQKAQRETIMTAEAQANKALQTASQAMGEALGQSMIASRLTQWRAYWTTQDPAKNTDYPTAATLAEVNKRILNAQARATGRLYVTSRAVVDAKAQEAKVDKSQAEAYAVADAAGQPRGRGLMYGQQAAQITKASAAATVAAAKATETALNATRASAADAKTLNALAMTQAHAAKAEFRRKAAEEAAVQAKAAADGAAAQAVKAAENASKAKAAQLRAEAAEQTAKTAAADAAAKRAKAEAERDYAKSQKELAESERGKAAAAETKAQSERQVAADQLAAAQSAGATAASKKDDALAAEGRARTARNGALEAERRRDTLTAKAEAAEALLAAVEGTEAAIEARAAATKARTAANNATAAATSARSAADDATEAATNARAAATRADGAAKRAQAAADGAKRDVAITEASVKKAHAAAADAIDAADAAKWNAITAKAEAQTAKQKAAEAKGHAVVARSEAVLAGADAIRTAGYAYATAQAATAARDSAAQVVKPANDAIELGSPYKETDSSAGLAVLTGQAAKTAAEQQAAVAKAKSEQAAKAAALAKELAAKASADAKAAAEAAASAAGSAANAAKSAEQAQASASAADASAKAAKRSEANTVAYNQQATEDAEGAQGAADSAGSYASQADAAATDAERDAASARSAATAAETDASTARGVADQAERDATTAEAAAANARNLAVEAAQAAIRTQTAEVEAQQEQERSGSGPAGVDGVVMRPSDDSKVDINPKSDCVGSHSGGQIGCEVDLEYHVYGEMDFYLETCPLPGVSRPNCGSSIKRDYLTSSPLDVTFREDKVHVDGLELTESVLKSLAWAAVKDIVDCAHLKLSGCLWLAGSIIIPELLFRAVAAAFVVRMAMVNGARLSTAIWGLRGSGLSASAVANFERAAGEALVGKCFPAGTKVATESGPKPIEQIKVGDRVWSTDQVTGRKSLQRVLKLFDRTVDQLVRIKTAGGEVEATDTHRFWVQDRGWVESRNLRAGDEFQTKAGASERVLSTSLVKGKTRVFNFEVESSNTYYVYSGSTPVLVHNECLETLIKDLVADGEHIFLGINPAVDDLAASLGGRTFNGRAFAKPVGIAGGKPAWMVGVEAAIENKTVRLAVSLDGVAGATTAEEALAMLVKRGQEVVGPNWQLATREGYGTAWEMATLRVKVLLEKRTFESIEWYWKNAPYEFKNSPADWIP